MRPMAIPAMVAGIQIQETRFLSANHSAVPMTAPTIRPPPSAAPIESTPFTTRSAMYPPIGKLTKIATTHSHIRGGVIASRSAARVGSSVALIGAPSDRRNFQDGNAVPGTGLEFVNRCDGSERLKEHQISCRVARAPYTHVGRAGSPHHLSAAELIRPYASFTSDAVVFAPVETVGLASRYANRTV